MVSVGQAYWGKTCFADGSMPAYIRPYLIVEVLEKGVYVLNVSSSKGKENKLIYKSNYFLKNNYPPFPKSSFVKLDSRKFISNEELKDFNLMCRGDKLNSKDLNFILKNHLK
ncbi:hypothetical protein [Xylocopilactobacillus apicola]|uniref:Uncharacterized protein n=1 Tax=Xylocopilactobacillus apicola TaxID=2932184 RepID=A0AAU9DZ27_9LACO|nr:hypothetical protein [Xylocopilactobacillus apicola]BDR59493.1 hypothetical protein XA3_19340 [Xylocopilactobacillus apicola]